MTYNVFSGTLNPTHFTSLPLTAVTHKQLLPALSVAHCTAVMTLDARRTLATACRLDYCNAVLYEATVQVMRRLEVMNAAARLVTSTSTSHKCSAMSYTGCRCRSEYSLKLHLLHSTVSETPVPHIFQHAYRRRISLAEPVSVLLNVEIWLR